MNWLKMISLLLSDRQIAFFLFLFRHRYWPCLNRPRSFSEKVQYIKLYNRNPLRAIVADRQKARDYVSNKSEECKLVEVFWAGSVFTRQVWDALPSQFVIKANHGSNMTEIVDKATTKFDDVSDKVASWLRKDYSKYGREWVYRDLDRYLIVEEKLSVNGSIPPDFKFFVCNGAVELVQVDLARFSDHRRNLYSRDFCQLDATLKYPSTGSLDKPLAYDKAIRIAEQLSEEFDFIRVDLYLVGADVYFGELTNTPENGYAKFTPTSLDFELGQKLPARIER